MNIKHSIIGIDQIVRWANDRYNVTAAGLLEGTGIRRDRLNDPHAVVDPVEELKFYRNLVKQCQGPDLGLRAGFQLTASSYGIWGLALQSSMTMLDGIKLGLRYIDFTYTFNHIYFEQTDRLGAIVIEGGKGLGELQPFMLQRDLGAVVRLIYDGLKPSLPFFEIRLSQASLSNRSKYESAVGCPIHLGCKRDEVRILRRDLSRSLNQANPLTWKLCCEQLDELYLKRKEAIQLNEKIKDYLTRHSHLSLKMEDVANQFGLGVRSLRRRLSVEGTSYKEIVEHVRQSLANEYLKQTNMTLEQVADKLGYSDSVSFSHAYKRWFDRAPRSEK